MLRVAVVAAVTVAAVFAACTSGSSAYEDHCPAGVGTPGTVQCLNGACNLRVSGDCCVHYEAPEAAATEYLGGRPGFVGLQCDEATDCDGGLCCATSNPGIYPDYWSACAPTWSACTQQASWGGSIQMCVASCECHDNWSCVDGACVHP